MKYIVTYEIRSAGRDAAIARFKATGGPTPPGATLLGRWTRADFSGGYALVESDDVTAVLQFALSWNDLIEIGVEPVVEDAALAEVLGRMS
ncbi:MAG: hypothetical protein DMF56_21185 [Acidobacteria bacterium]|nr:MAG: hypothetical protein DMF56_21185 [Acidobacteriota bacterium]